MHGYIGSKNIQILHDNLDNLFRSLTMYEIYFIYLFIFHASLQSQKLGTFLEGTVLWFWILLTGNETKNGNNEFDEEFKGGHEEKDVSM